MKLSVESAVCGFSCRTSNKQSVRLHFVIGSYIADLSEQKDMLGVKQTSCTSNPCQLGHVRIADLKLNTNARLRTLEDTRTFLNTYESMMVTAHEMERSKPAAAKYMGNDLREKLNERSIHLIVQALHNIPFFSVTPCLDIFYIFSIEVIHVFHIGISRMVKDSECKRLCYSNIWTDCYKMCSKKSDICLNYPLKHSSASEKVFGRGYTAFRTHTTWFIRQKMLKGELELVVCLMMMD